MRIVQLFFPGHYEDALVYMGRLLLFTANRSVETISLSDLADDLNERFSDSHFAIRLAVLRNDWLQSPQFLGMMEDPQIAAFVGAQFDKLTKSPIEVPQSRKSEQDLQLQSRALLDFLLYYQRLYVAADDGFYHFDGDWDGDATLKLGQSVKRDDVGSFCLSARLGTVNVSCGEAGLFSAFDDFNWVGSQRNQLEKSADASIRTSWVGFNLVNYRTPKQIDVLMAHRKSNPEHGGDKKVITGFSSSRVDFAETASPRKKGVSDLSSAYFFDNQGFEQDTTGVVTALRLTAPRREGYVPREKERHTLATPGDRILSLSISSVGPVLELKNSVVLCSIGGNWSTLIADRVLNVRTFKDSKHYQNLVCITTEEGIHIMSCVEIGPLGSREDAIAEDG